MALVQRKVRFNREKVRERQCRETLVSGISSTSRLNSPRRAIWENSFSTIESAARRLRRTHCGLLATGGEARPTDIARRLGVSHATAINTISR